ncbi:hypothetical protein HQ590_11130 [bacterium]|nr:hypothetical protein [bacterium]
MTGYQHRKGIRFEYREQQRQRVQNSPSLARRFRHLKALTVLLDYCDPRAIIQNGRVKYSVNVDNAKSVFRFDCRNSECVQGDFDLTGPLAKAVAKKRTGVKGEMLCQGWQSKATVDSVRCHSILRYDLRLAY